MKKDNRGEEGEWFGKGMGKRKRWEREEGRAEDKEQREIGGEGMRRRRARAWRREKE